MNTKKQNKANFKVAQASVLGVNQSPPPADSSLLPFPLSLLTFLQNKPNFPLFHTFTFSPLPFYFLVKRTQFAGSWPPAAHWPLTPRWKMVL